jgi:hypothetical protein
MVFPSQNRGEFHDFFLMFQKTFPIFADQGQGRNEAKNEWHFI